MTIIQHDKKLYELRDLGNGFIGHVPANITLQDGTPSMRWSGAKIPRSVWQEIVAFFQWSYKETKSETQVRLLLNVDTGEFKAHAFPQKYGTGMTAKELSDNADYANQLNAQMSGGNWIKLGTVHHHCSTGAFQSGTDSADETEMGLHITLGNIGGLRHSIHGRVSLTIPGTLNADGTAATKATHAYYSAIFFDWFEIPDVGIPISDSIREEIAKFYLCTPEPEDAKFPPQWAENLIKEEPKPIVHRAVGFSTTAAHEQAAWSRHLLEDDYNYSSYCNGHAAAAAEPARRVTQQPSKAKWPDSERLEEFAEWLENLMRSEDITQANLFGIMHFGQAHSLSDKEWDICQHIERELARLDVGWDEYVESYNLY